jgi:hypothetical protein
VRTLQSTLSYYKHIIIIIIIIKIFKLCKNIVEAYGNEVFKSNLSEITLNFRVFATFLTDD